MIHKHVGLVFRTNSQQWSGPHFYFLYFLVEIWTVGHRRGQVIYLAPVAVANFSDLPFVEYWIAMQ